MCVSVCTRFPTITVTKKDFGEKKFTGEGNLIPMPLFGHLNLRHVIDMRMFVTYVIPIPIFILETKPIKLSHDFYGLHILYIRSFLHLLGISTTKLCIRPCRPLLS